MTPAKKTEEEVVVESPKVTVSFERKVQVREYESATASIHVQAPTSPLSGDAVEDKTMITEAVKYAFFQAKTAVFEQLGITFEVTQENVVLERLEKVLSVTEVTSNAPAAAPSKSTPSQAGKTKDKADAWANLAASPKTWWDNREGKRNARAPDFKPKDDNPQIEKGVGLWLDASPEGLVVPGPGSF